ncbi:MAG: general secretion pathway protein GspK [Bacteroidetes bacterium]|nr:general secretion pathway protein GspK [Bacteroidota bacterium]
MRKHNKVKKFLEKILAPESDIRTQKGIILIIVLWVLTILMVIVLSFSVMARTESYSTLAYREELEKKFLAEAGVERGIAELFYRNLFKNANIFEEGRRVWRADGTAYSVLLSPGYFTVKIIDESGKIDINTLTDLSGIILRSLLINSGIQERDASEIVDSILDWKDADDLRRLNGAEDDFYMSLPVPYKAKNGRFDTLEELLLVKGITPGILYGGNQKKGILDFITIYSNSTTINLLSAPKEVLLAVPGFTPEIADEIISKREDLSTTGVLNVTIPQESTQFVKQTGSSNAYTIESAGYKDKDKAAFAVRATVIIDTANKFQYVYYKSPVQVRK